MSDEALADVFAFTDALNPKRPKKQPRVSDDALDSKAAEWLDRMNAGEMRPL